MKLRFLANLILSFVIVSNAHAGSATPSPNFSEPVNCSCGSGGAPNSCGVEPHTLKKKTDLEIARELGFEISTDNIAKKSEPNDAIAAFQAFANFLEKSDHAPMLYPEYYTRATKENSILTLKSVFKPKNATEVDEYFRCTIPSDKYCLYRKHLHSYIGLAAKASGLPFSFLACQAYVESRFDKNARSGVGAMGYSQIKPENIRYLNEVLKKSIRQTANRSIASVVTSTPRINRISRAQQEIASIWKEFWKGTPNAPKNLNKCDLTCYRQAFLAQAISLKTDMVVFATSSSGLKADYDDIGDFLIEGMDKGDSLLLLAGSYNVGVTSMIRLVSNFCKGSTKIKDCLDRMVAGKFDSPSQEQARKRDVASITNYVGRIRDCSQQFMAEQIDFDDDARWSTEERSAKQNGQRDGTVQCLLHPCPFK